MPLDFKFNLRLPDANFKKLGTVHQTLLLTRRNLTWFISCWTESSLSSDDAELTGKARHQSHGLPVCQHPNHYIEQGIKSHTYILGIFQCLLVSVSLSHACPFDANSGCVRASSTSGNSSHCTAILDTLPPLLASYINLLLPSRTLPFFLRSPPSLESI